MFYNAINPGQIKKLILLDVGLSLQRLQMVPMNEYYKSFYDAHYVDYHKQITERKAYSKEEALKAVVKARGVNREQAEIILSRNLIQIGDDRFVWVTKVVFFFKATVFRPDILKLRFTFKIQAKNMNVAI